MTVIALALAGCTSQFEQPRVSLSTGSGTSALTGSIIGSVHGGGQAILGATIQIYQVGSTGDATGAVALLNPAITTSDGSGSANGNANVGNGYNALPAGSFTLHNLFSCPTSGSSYVYIVATGGQTVTAGAPNAQIALISFLGDCAGLTSSTTISVNEVTTVAAVVALLPYMTSAKSIGYGNTDAAQFQAAAALVPEYVNSAMGTSPGPSLPSGYYASTLQINSLANSLAACVNSTGGVSGDSNNCGRLFEVINVPGQPVPTDIVGAAIKVVSNPTFDASDIYNIAAANPPFQPSLSSAPASWSFPIVPDTTAPAISLPSGTYTGTQTIVILDKATSATIHYTLDGSQPSVSSPIYVGPIAISGSETVNAIAATLTSGTSSTATASYTIVPGNPAFSYQPLATYLPHLYAALQGAPNSANSPIYFAAFGSSVGVGATLPDANSQSPVSVLTSKLATALAPAGNFNLRPANFSVNGSISYQVGAAIGAMGQALGGVSVHAPGSGYAVGDFLTVQQGNSPSGMVIVTSVDANGGITGLSLSSYPNSITDADLSSPSTGGYTIASNVPLVNGPSSVVSVAEQTGTGSGATVDITKVGITPTVVVLAYGMNDGQVAQYNSGETLGGFEIGLQYAMQYASANYADCIVMTSPHPAVVTYAERLYQMPAGLPEIYPVYIAPNVTPDQLVPSAANSNVTQDFLGKGTAITMGYRYLQVNAAMRSLAAQYNCNLVDAEPYWMQAIQQYQISTGSAVDAETTLIDPGQIVHPNLLGHQLSYDLASGAFVSKLTTH